MCIICLIHSQTIDLRVYEGLQELLKKDTHLKVHRNILHLTNTRGRSRIRPRSRSRQKCRGEMV